MRGTRAGERWSVAWSILPFLVIVKNVFRVRLHSKCLKGYRNVLALLSGYPKIHSFLLSHLFRGKIRHVSNLRIRAHRKHRFRCALSWKCLVFAHHIFFVIVGCLTEGILLNEILNEYHAISFHVLSLNSSFSRRYFSSDGWRMLCATFLVILDVTFLPSRTRGDILFWEVKAILACFVFWRQIYMRFTGEVVRLHVDFILCSVWRASFVCVSPDPSWRYVCLFHCCDEFPCCEYGIGVEPRLIEDSILFFVPDSVWC
jgi:hypothetical protein